jgi:hypothetical protein
MEHDVCTVHIGGWPFNVRSRGYLQPSPEARVRLNLGGGQSLMAWGPMNSARGAADGGPAESKIGSNSHAATAGPSNLVLHIPTVNRAEAAGAIQSDALTLRIFVIRLVGSDLRASRFCRTWPNMPPNRRFYG